MSWFLARHKYPDEMYDTAKSIVVLGFAFITEGAIPYAAADPLRDVPRPMAGSVVAGAASISLDLTMPAPHGGILVVPLSNSPLLFLGTILLDSVITAAAATSVKPAETQVDGRGGAVREKQTA